MVLDYFFFNFSVFQGIFVVFSLSWLIFSFFYRYFFGFSMVKLVFFLSGVKLVPSSVGKINEIKGLILIMWGVFILICSRNLMGLLPYVYGKTTKVYFVLFVSLWVWVRLVVSSAFYNFRGFVSHFCPEGSPLVLGGFLRVVEVVRTGIRPLTLTLRLVAKMITGHILIGLMTLVSRGLFLRGSIVSALVLFFLGSYVLFEVVISLVQGKVFFMLVKRYSGEHS